MGNTPFNEDAAAALTKGFKRLHKRWETEHREKLSDDRLSREIFAANDGDVVVSRQTVHQLHHGEKNPNTMSAEALLAICQFLGGTPEDLGPAVVRRAQRLTVLVDESRRRHPRKAAGKRRPPQTSNGVVDLTDDTQGESGSRCTSAGQRNDVPEFAVAA